MNKSMSLFYIDTFKHGLAKKNLYIYCTIASSFLSEQIC